MSLIESIIGNVVVFILAASMIVMVVGVSILLVIEVYDELNGRFFFIRRKNKILRKWKRRKNK